MFGQLDHQLTGREFSQTDKTQLLCLPIGNALTEISRFGMTKSGMTLGWFAIVS